MLTPKTVMGPRCSHYEHSLINMYLLCKILRVLVLGDALA